MNIEQYTLSNIAIMEQTYSDFLDKNEGVDFNFPGFKFSKGKK